MKSGDIATPVDTLEAEVKRLERAYDDAVSQVDKQQIARDKEAAEDKIKKLAEETHNKSKKTVTKKKKKSKK